MNLRVGIYRSSFLMLSETFVRDHILQMPRYFTVVATSRLLDGGLESVPGHPVHAEVSNATLRIVRRLKRRVGFSEDVIQRRALKRLLAGMNVGVMHAHFGTDGALIFDVCRELNIPLVVTFHGYDAMVRPEILKRDRLGSVMVARWSDYIAYVSRFVAVSGSIRDELIARGVPRDKVVVIPCGADIELIQPQTSSISQTICFVGRMVEKKGVLDLLNALSKIENPFRLNIVGAGPLEEDAKRVAAHLKIDAVFHGSLPHEQVLTLMAESSLVAIPSKRASNGDSEGSPVTAIEASALGKPIVAYAHSGLVESVVHEVTGLLVEEGNIDELSQALARLMSDAELRDSLGKGGREFVKTAFNRSQLLEELATVYDEVLEERH
jgi:colanic acid/amylovoran biosynthesis glycosyltransferase